ncbi:MAG: hydroxyacid dehydrogenase [Bacteroidia bacterium]|nr:hydroxyacid dehydrogenase [Bacteroidia bacterium]
MKILFIDSTHPSLAEKLTAAGFQCDLNYNRTPEEIVNNLYLYDGIVIRSKLKLTRELIDKAVRLKFIARVGAGMENIDTVYAESKGIKCLHAPEGNRDAVAEHALAILLCLFNNICKSNQEVREGKWLRESNRGIELAGKTVGIIGYGNMGSAFAERLAGFNCKIIAYDKYKKNFRSTLVNEVQLDDIFKHADILSLHLPLTQETNYLVDDTFINKFNNNIYIINTSRGKILNTDALVKNMKSGKVLGACLDVLEYETTSFENIDVLKLPESFQYLIRSNRVILTPHIAGWTHESNEKMAAALVSKIKMFAGLKE